MILSLGQSSVESYCTPRPLAFQKGTAAWKVNLKGGVCVSPCWALRKAHVEELFHQQEMLGALFREAQINEPKPLCQMAAVPYDYIYYQIKLLAYAFHSCLFGFLSCFTIM